MQRELLRGGERVLGILLRRALSVFRVLVDHGPRWAQQRVWGGEKLGVLLLFFLWLILPTALVFLVVF